MGHLTFALVALLSVACAHRRAATYAACDAIVAREQRAGRIPALSYGIVESGKLAHSAGFGAGGEVPDADTVYRIGSLTKSFTALAILALRDDGKLALDEPLGRLLPEAATLPPITLRQILTHMSGLPAVGALDVSKLDHPPTEAELLASLRLVALDAPPGARFGYSNLGYALLAVAAARAAGVPFRELIAARVLRPLAMTSTVWDERDVPAGRLATAHRKGVVVPHWRLGAAEGAAGLYSSVRDLARFVAFELAAASAAVRETQRAAVPPEVSDGRSESYGFGWSVITTRDGALLLQHGGGTEGYRSNVTMWPARGLGVIVLTSTNDAHAAELAERLLGELARSRR